MNKKFFALFLCVCLLLVMLAACGQQEGPPESDQPEPPALNGTYVSDYGTLVFNGDGRSAAWTLGPELAEFTGLPAEADGTYVFLFRNEEWRRDKAESFRLQAGEASYQFGNALGEYAEGAVSIMDPDFADGETMLFVLQADE